MTHNHDMFEKLHGLLETIEKEHEDKFRVEVLEPINEILAFKFILLKARKELKGFIQYNKDYGAECDLELESMMDDMMEKLAVGITIDVDFDKSQYSLKDYNEMENSLRMLFEDTLKCEPLITLKSHETKYHIKYPKKDEIVFEKSFHGSEYDEQCNESTPFKQVKCSGAVPKYNEPTFQLPFVPRYTNIRKIVDPKRHQTERFIKNVESEIVQIISADSLSSIHYRSNNSSELKVCSLFNMEQLNASDISYQKDIIRYFLVK